MAAAKYRANPLRVHLIGFGAIARMVMSKIVPEDGVAIAAVLVREGREHSLRAGHPDVPIFCLLPTVSFWHVS